MQLTVRNVAKFLDVTEDAVYRMIDDCEIPVVKVNDQFRFNKTDLLEWAMSRQLHVSPVMLEGDESDCATTHASLSEALRLGGVFHNLPGVDKTAALRSLVEVMQLPDDVDRELLLRMYMARETMASTGIGDGIAIPHVRNPVVLRMASPQITLGFTKNPVDFGAPDGKPVFAMFALVTPTTRSHLLLLSRLAFALRTSSLLDLIKAQAPKDELIAEFKRCETSADETGKAERP
ncbi:MAG: PTS sugar transporter subunit IIA [bacterium]